MYSQFCKNLNNYMNIINSDNEKPNARKQIAQIILPLADIRSYMEYKKNDNPKYKEIANLIYNLSQYSDVYPSIKRLVWELWAYGFDIELYEEMNSENYNMDEIATLIDLMMSTHYLM